MKSIFFQEGIITFKVRVLTFEVYIILKIVLKMSLDVMSGGLYKRTGGRKSGLGD